MAYPIFFHLSFGFLHFLISTNLHAGHTVGVGVGRIVRGAFVFDESEPNSSRSLSPFLFLFLSSCHLDAQQRRRERKRTTATFLKMTSLKLKQEVLECEMRKCNYRDLLVNVNAAALSTKHTLCCLSPSTIFRNVFLSQPNVWPADRCCSHIGEVKKATCCSWFT